MIAITPEEVSQYLRLTREDDVRDLADPVAAVNSMMSRWGIEDTEAAHFGAVMLAARLYRRRNSPAGVEAFGELGPVYVSRYDSDLAMILEIDQWKRPQIA